MQVLPKCVISYILGDQVPTNAFLSPRWGGVMVYNVEDPANDTVLPAEIHINMQSAMEVFLSQLRLLIGVPAQSQVCIIKQVLKLLDVLLYSHHAYTISQGYVNPV